VKVFEASSFNLEGASREFARSPVYIGIVFIEPGKTKNDLLFS
jgi:hypothetical protein